MPAHGYDNQIAVLSPVRPDGKLSTLFQPEHGAFVGDVELHFDAARLLFSMPKPNGRWQVHEMGVDGRGLRQVSADDPADVDNYDPCYLPDGRIIFCSTRCFHGVPCVGGGDKVANLFIMDADGKNVRQLTFDQDHDWCPTLLNNGRVLYTRWEYSDAPHYFSRLLFTMNPDGTNQAAYYGSNSYWPNSMFYARPVPGHPTKVVAIVSGHHGVQRMGEMVVLDPALGRYEETRGRAADPRLRAEGRADHPRRLGQRLVAQIPPSLSAQREVFPGFLQADAQRELGPVPRRYVRQLRAAPGRAGLRHAGAACRSARRPRRR